MRNQQNKDFVLFLFSFKVPQFHIYVYIFLQRCFTQCVKQRRATGNIRTFWEAADAVTVRKTSSTADTWFCGVISLDVWSFITFLLQILKDSKQTTPPRPPILVVRGFPNQDIVRLQVKMQNDTQWQFLAETKSWPGWPSYSWLYCHLVRLGDTGVKIMVYCRGGICQCRQCRRQCKIFASGVNFPIFTHFLCFYHLNCWN